MPFMYHNCSANTRETCANAANYEKCCFMSEWRRLPLPQRRSSEFARCRQGSNSQNVPRDFHFDSCRQNPHSLLECGVRIERCHVAARAEARAEAPALG